ncbi:hypothetical protein GXW83_13465 [Streptacidiphilus sp. PB12-B1b]|uniref:hypothetical protein n=1 Tax=Streptacidiphilus sp. PB12-B1b TaxID=2705012 RepID=UPI0015FAF4A3|nr:hypothetical protein [Streptacidiphilus sp. PB12-B1b]QMU76598.1 hypothetical protein GXW83_13465 [Streptacidiphilus sp. PB12-B1b]
MSPASMSRPGTARPGDETRDTGPVTGAEAEHEAEPDAIEAAEDGGTSDQVMHAQEESKAEGDRDGAG